MRRFFEAVIAIVLLGAVAAVIFIYSGVYDVGAAARHGRTMRFILHTTMERSVAVRAEKESLPPGYDDLPHLRLAAAHFSEVCARCHGAPGLPAPTLGQVITPVAPSFSVLAKRFTDGELFWIVQHGVKMTAMPSWPSPSRRDEIWSMVALVKALPTMVGADFRDLAYGPLDRYPADPVISLCAQCHGADGNGRAMAHMPVLAGQKPGYLGLSLQLFRSGQRSSGIMRMMASRLSDDDIRRIATYFAGASRDVPPAQAPPQAIARGGTLAEKGDRAHDIPACRSCHGPQPERADPMIPDIRGQRADYIEEQLRLFKDGIRGNSKYARMMHEAAQSLHPDEMAALAAYYASLTPEPHFP